MSFPATSVANKSVSYPQHKRLSRDPSPSNQPHTPSTPEEPWITVPTANRFGMLNDMDVKPHSQRHSPGGRSRHGTVLSSANPAPHKDLTVTNTTGSIICVIICMIALDLKITIIYVARLFRRLTKFVGKYHQYTMGSFTSGDNYSKAGFMKRINDNFILIISVSNRVSWWKYFAFRDSVWRKLHLVILR